MALGLTNIGKNPGHRVQRCGLILTLTPRVKTESKACLRCHCRAEAELEQVHGTLSLHGPWTAVMHPWSPCSSCCPPLPQTHLTLRLGAAARRETMRVPVDSPSAVLACSPGPTGEGEPQEPFGVHNFNNIFKITV